MTRILTALLLLFAAGCSGNSARPAPVASASAGTRAALPTPRTEVAYAVWDGGVVVAGGFGADGRTVALVEVYDPAADVWRTGVPLPEPRNHAAAAVLGGRLYVSGGNDGKQVLDSVVSIGPGETSWRSEPRLRQARSAHAMVAAGGRLVAFGGAVDGRALSSTETFAGGAWSPGPDLGVAREHLAGAADGERVYAIGGRVGGLSGNLGTVEEWQPGSDTGWRRAANLTKARGGTSAAATPDGPCVAGGEEPGATIAEVECLRDGAWRVVARLAEPRHGLAVVAVGSTLHVVGGGPKPALSVSPAHETFLVSRVRS